jgi:hypothetical protein
MIDITKLLEIIKKQGATGVLAMWLWYTHSEVQELKQRLYDCYKKEQVVEVLTKEHSYFAIKPEDEINGES